MARPRWDFDYFPLPHGYRAEEPGTDFVVATVEEHGVDALASAAGAPASALLIRKPLFWYRFRTDERRTSADVSTLLERRGVAVRYVTSSVQGSMGLGAPWDPAGAATAVPREWSLRAPRAHDEPCTEGRWFLTELGVDADRVVAGTGAGTRLAVIDDQGCESDSLDLEREVEIGTTKPMRGSTHGAAMVGWAVGTRGAVDRALPPFAGVAPDASPRLYFIPKPGQEVLWLPLAIVRAVDDGADVVVCATYIDGTTSPLLNDALEFASTLGRGGLGTPVLFPTSREVSSPAHSVHASLTLGLADPASDPRAICVAPSGRDGRWFLWTDKNGGRRPFANRGAAVRVAAPGDDMAYPFSREGRLAHAESSGASAIAAGVVALVLGRNPELSLADVHAVLTRTATRCEPSEGEVADAADLLPEGADADRHDAKTGYGRLSARRACLAVVDPVSGALAALGEERAAARYLMLRETVGTLRSAYSPELARWAAGVLLRDPTTTHACHTLVRHFRLVAGHDDRREAQTKGATARLLALVLARLAGSGVPPRLREEVQRLRGLIAHGTRSVGAGATLEAACFALATELWRPDADGTRTTRRSAAPSIGAAELTA